MIVSEGMDKETGPLYEQWLGGFMGSAIYSGYYFNMKMKAERE